MKFNFCKGKTHSLQLISHRCTVMKFRLHKGKTASIKMAKKGTAHSNNTAVRLARPSDMLSAHN